MIAILYLFGAVTDISNDLLPPQTHSNYTNPIWRDVFLIGGGLAILGIILFLWAYLIRKPQTVSSSSSSRSGSHRGLFSRRRKKRRHSRNRTQWQRNPTLAETGGLPPPRDDDPPQP